MDFIFLFLVGAIVMLPFFHAPADKHHLYGHSATLLSTNIIPRGDFVWCLVSVDVTQGLPLDYLALVITGTCNPGSHRTVTI